MIQLTPLHGSVEVLKVLDDRACRLYEYLCFHFEPSAQWVQLPYDLQREVDEGRWNSAVAQLQVKGLVRVAIGSVTGREAA